MRVCISRIEPLTTLEVDVGDLRDARKPHGAKAAGDFIGLVYFTDHGPHLYELPLILTLAADFASGVAAKGDIIST
jgi:hypothetical protein